MSRAPRTRCDSCGATMPKAVRIEDGYAYCRKCYQVTFEHTHCGQCGSDMRAHYNEANPVCRDCKRAGRVCLRCGRSFQKAGRVVRGGALCSACAPHFNTPSACAACKGVTKRLSRVSWFEGPLCDSCRRPDHITCAVCRRHRPHAGQILEGKPVCGNCLPGAERTHDCPDCGEQTAGGGSAPCRGCAVARRAWRRARLNAELLDQDWSRDLFLAFCSWLVERCRAGDITRRIDTYARFFEILDKRIPRLDHISQSQLAAIFTPEELRRRFIVVRFLIENHGMEWNKPRAREAAHSRRNLARLLSCRDEPWYELVEEYVDYLRARPSASGDTVGENTIGTYLNAAIGLLRFAGPTSSRELSPDAVRRFVRRHSGYAASLVPFVTYLRTVKGVDVELAVKMPLKRREFERKLVREVRLLLERLEVTDNRREALALLARSISRIYQFPLVTVLALRWDQVAIAESRISISLGDESIELAGELAAPASKWLARGYPESLVFPGRIPSIPLSRSGVDYHLGRLLEDAVGG